MWVGWHKLQVCKVEMMEMRNLPVLSQPWGCHSSAWGKGGAEQGWDLHWCPPKPPNLDSKWPQPSRIQHKPHMAALKVQPQLGTLKCEPEKFLGTAIPSFQSSLHTGTAFKCGAQVIPHHGKKKKPNKNPQCAGTDGFYSSNY